jgi:hypothetical protein
MSPPKNILVLGLGELSHSIVTSLANLKPPDTTISVLIRPSTLSSPSPSKALQISTLSTLGINFLPVDILSLQVSDLSSLFKPYDLVISALGYASKEGGLQTKITHAVLSAKIPRYIPWQFGADYDLVGRGSAQPVWDEQLDIRDLLRSTSHSTSWTIVSTGLFTSFLFEPSFGIVGKDGERVVVRALGEWENNFTVTAPEDIGRLTAEIVFTKPPFDNQIVYTAGDTITYSRLAYLLDEALGEKVKRVLWTVEQLEGELREDPDNNIKRYRVAFAIGRGVSWDMETTFNWKKGIKVVDVKEFLGRNLERIKKGEESAEKWN